MLRRFVKIFKERFSVTQKSLQMAESTELLKVGGNGKRAAEDSDLSAASKKKKKHNITLGKSEGFKRKVALLVAYNGAGYYGVQINRGFKTIESELFPALVKVGAVPQEHIDNTTKMWFQRGSRTDKGVSAVGQTFSLKMVIVPDVVSKLNENLPEQIRVLGYIRTTNGFDSKNFCCGRTYMYMTPTFAFAPLEKFITDDYRITDDRLDQVRDILKKYIGTHKFHNFTSGVKYEQANASRYIISFECSEPYVRDGVEFVTLRVRGQSFMLHQIRKMIGLTIAILRGYCGESALTKSWDAERIDIPKAPGLGLVLEALHFDGYNKKFGIDGIHEPIDWSPQKDAMDEFKEKYIISYIVKQEKTDRVMLNWLQTLQFHNFDENRAEGPQKPWARIAKSKDIQLNAAPGNVKGDAEFQNSCECEKKSEEQVVIQQEVSEEQVAIQQEVSEEQVAIQQEVSEEQVAIQQEVSEEQVAIQQETNVPSPVSENAPDMDKIHEDDNPPKKSDGI